MFPWCNWLLRLSLYRVVQGDGAGKEFIFDKSSRASTWKSDHMTDLVKCSVMGWPLAGSEKPARLLVYRYRFAKFIDKVAGCRIYWSETYAQHSLWPDKIGGRYKGNRLSGYIDDLLTSIGLPKAFAQKTTRAIIDKANVDELNLPPAAILQSTGQCSCSTAALLLFYCWILAREGKKGFDAGHARPCLEGVLQLFVSKAQADFIVTVQDCDLKVHIYPNSTCCLSGASSKASLSLWGRLECQEETASLAEFCAVLMTVWKFENNAQRSTRVLAGSLLKTIVLAVQNLAEDTVGDTNFWTSFNFFELPMLHGATGRARQVPVEVKTEILEETGRGKAIKRPLDLVASDALLSEKRKVPGDGSLKMSRRAASRMVEDEMLAYGASGRICFKGDTFWHICLDGLRVSGEEVVHMVYWSVRSQLGMWMAPKVLCSSSPSLFLLPEEYSQYRKHQKANLGGFEPHTPIV